jgi:Na+-transporting NADH:ubiquinone oxidoreductase subunit NqrB
MDIASIILFACGALVGVLMLIQLLKGHHIPKGLTIIHGLLVVSGLILLLCFNFTHSVSAHWVSVGFFVIAAVLGLYVLSKDIKHQKVPLPIVLTHGGAAVTGFIILVVRTFFSHSS